MMTYKEYMLSCINDLPIWMYEIALSFFVLGVIFILRLVPGNRRFRWISRLFLAEYIVLTLASTVLFRPVSAERKFNFIPFWSYQSIQDGADVLIIENFLNVLAFIPMGIAFAWAFSYKSLLKAVLFTMGLSFFIEVLQYVCQRGFSELDDVFHNTMGGVIGYIIARLIKEKRKIKENYAKN